jgi:hypothetical protein
MNRWEYLTLEFSKSYGVTAYVLNGEKFSKFHNLELHVALNELGKQGWEVVSINGDGNYFAFKRPLIVKTGQLKAQQAQSSAPTNQ